MDTLSFTAEMTKALAWPLTIILALLLLRRPLADLIPLLQRLRYKDLELDFGKRVQELASEIKKELPGGRPSSVFSTAACRFSSSLRMASKNGLMGLAEVWPAKPCADIRPAGWPTRRK